MVDDEVENQQHGARGSSIFVVRLGEGNGSNFAICEQVGMVEGSRRLPGSGKTVADLVADQALMAAAISAGDQDGLQSLAFLAQSGENELGRDN
jgi:hypothetical protein